MLNKITSFFILGVLIFTIFACCSQGNESKDGQTSNSDGIEKSKKGGFTKLNIQSKQVLRWVFNTELPELDPLISNEASTGYIYNQLIEGLCVYNPKTLKPEPGIAESWEHKNFQYYKFNLRKNAKWSNGDPVTSEDFIYTWQTILNKKNNSPNVNFFYYIKNAEEYYNQVKGYTDFSVVGIKAPDDYTIEIELKKPVTFFIEFVCSNYYQPIPKKVHEKFGKDWILPKNIVCNGPFTLSEINLENRYLLLQKNENYWDKDSVRLTHAIMYFLDSENVAYQLFKQGEVDIVNRVPINEFKKAYDEKNPNATITETAGTFFLMFNTNITPTDDTRVRKALNLAINKKELVQRITQAGEKQAITFVNPSIYPSPEYSERVKKEVSALGYDPETAKKLMKEYLTDYKAKYKKNMINPIILNYNYNQTNKAIVDYLQIEWKTKLNVDIITEAKLDMSKHIEAMRQGKFQLGRMAWICDAIDPSNLLELFMPENSMNFTKYNNPNFIENMNKANIEANSEKRMNLLCDAEIIISKDLPFIPLYYTMDPFMKRTYVKECYNNIKGLWFLKGVYLEKD